MYTFFGPRAKGTPSDSLRVRSAHSVTRCATRARLLLGECQRAVGDRENSEDGARLRRWRGRVAAAPYSGSCATRRCSSDHHWDGPRRARVGDVDVGEFNQALVPSKFPGAALHSPREFSRLVGESELVDCVLDRNQ